MWRMRMEQNSIRKLVIDIGNSRTKLLVGEMSEDFTKMKVLEYKEISTKGMKRSLVESSEELAKALQEGLAELTSLKERPLKKVTIGFGGKHIRSKTQKVSSEFPEKIIQEADIEKLYQLAESGLSSEDRVLKREMYNIKVNNMGTVKEAVGIESDGLEASVHLIYINEADIEKMLDAIASLGLEVENMYLNAFASLKSTLVDEDFTKMGVALIDIGEGSTDIIMLKNQKVIYSQSANLGGMHFVSDIMYLFHLAEDEAKKVFDLYITGNMKEGYMSRAGKQIQSVDVEGIIDARIGDIANFIKRTIEESGFTGYLAEGVVVTGGVADLDRLVGKIKEKMGGIVRRKKPFPIRGLEEPNYNMATVIGLFLEAMEAEMYKRQRQAEESERVFEEEYDELSELLEEREDTKKESSEEKESFFKKIVSYFV